LTLIGCSPNEHDIIVAKIGNDPLTLGEYERVYVKSNGSREVGATASQADREKFLDLILKYKLKLKDAYSRGFDKTPEVIQEIEQYKGSLAQSFLTEREIVSPGVRQLYNRRLEEIRVAHILLELSPNASPQDSAAAYKKAYETLAELKAGKDFGALAATLSKDPSARDNKGDLYYATGGDFVPSFEDAAYTLKPGEIFPTPVRTRFGLHIIKMLDRKPAPGEVHESHIMVRFPSMSPSPEDTANAYAKIRKIEDSVALGIDFAALAKRNSEDGGSAARGGDLGWFTRRRWVRPFDDTAMVLNVGQVSGIVRTSYGYHIIKCYEHRGVKSFEDAKQEIEALYQQRRFPDENANFLNGLKMELQYARYDSVVARFLAVVDSSKTLHDSAWAANISTPLRKATVLSILGRPVTLDSVLNLMQNRPDLGTTLLRSQQFGNALDKISEQLMFAKKADFLEEQNADFAMVMQEYKEGVLLYQVEQQQIWSKITPTDSVLRAYFSAHREKFTFPDRVRFTEIRLSNEANAQAARQQLLAGEALEHLVREDSLRLELPNKYVATFSQRSASLSPSTRKSLAAVAEQLKNDAGLNVRFTATPDTLKDKSKNLDLASRRIQAMKAFLTKDYNIPENRVLLNVTALTGDTTLDAKDRSTKSVSVNVDILGRHARVIGPLDSGVVAPSADERAKRADSLSIGSFTMPFSLRNGYSIVRLDGREPARQKTFEEASAEVSTSFQDYEAKRLEKEWIDGVKQRFPVTEERENLKNAFKATP
jgi:peptidyl-prolyl cis-trans isomerase SurA